MHTEVNEEEEMKDSPENEEEQKDEQNSGEKCVFLRSIRFQITRVFLPKIFLRYWHFTPAIAASFNSCNEVFYNFALSAEKSAGDANKNLKKLTKEDIAELSERLGENWKKLATELNFPEDDIDYFASESDVKKQATIMLTVWLVSFTNSFRINKFKERNEGVQFVLIAFRSIQLAYYPHYVIVLNTYIWNRFWMLLVALRYHIWQKIVYMFHIAWDYRVEITNFTFRKTKMDRLVQWRWHWKK